MSDLVYAGLVLAGATTLLIEAYRNFNATSARHPFELHPVLKEVEVRNLCTTGEIVVGFAFYAFLYLVAYAVLLTSAEIYGLLVQAHNALGEIGATDTDAGITDPAFDEAISLSSSNYNKPFIVSALIISSLSLGAVKPIETTMRSLAHRLAGVPRGVYKVIEHLKLVPYDEIMASHPTPLKTLFNEQFKSLTKEQKSAIKHCTGQIRDTLCSIDCLRLATDPGSRGLYFPLYNLERLRGLSKTIDDQYDSLRETIGNLPSGRSQENGGGNGDGAGTEISQPEIEKCCSDLVKKATEISANMMAYFAVLFIRNNRAVFSPLIRAQTSRDPDRSDPVSEMRKYIFRPEKDEHNAFALSLVIAFALSFIFSIVMYHIWQYWYVAEKPDLYADFGSGEAAIRAWLRTRFNDIVKSATIDQFQSLAVTAVSVLLVIIGREVRIEEQSWRGDWSFYQFPFLRFLSMSLLSGFAACFLVALVRSADLWWEADFSLTESQIIGLFRDQGRYFAFQAGGGIILAMTSLTIADKHRDTGVYKTLAVSVLGGGIYYLYQWAILFITVPFPPKPAGAFFTQTTRDALIYSTLPFCFLLVFALILEFSEGGGASGAQSENDTSRLPPRPAEEHK
ncbi:hypothetical protein I6F11_27350 [Ensifer sp. NBAIM29]|nr:hypothetical protein [Ensifer sp. NBAIM29]